MNLLTLVSTAEAVSMFVLGFSVHCMAFRRKGIGEGGNDRAFMKDRQTPLARLP